VVLDLVVIKSDDGYNADVPSVKGCDSWAHDEDEVIEKAVNMLRFYINLPEESEIKIDRARHSNNKTVYKLVFDK
jgi:predicted RNase H-like HicB family nuclease